MQLSNLAAEGMEIPDEIKQSLAHVSKDTLGGAWQYEFENLLKAQEQHLIAQGVDKEDVQKAINQVLQTLDASSDQADIVWKKLHPNG